MKAPRLVPLVLALALYGCGDLKDFCGTYQGPIVEGSFVRSCFRDDVKATLRFNPEKAVATPGRGDAGLTAPPPNTLTTDDGFFNETVLEPVSGLVDDHLSLLDFPGPERLRNYLLIARPTAGPLANRDAMVVVSLLASEQVEVRVIARSSDGSAPCATEPEGSAEGAPRTYFGFYRMKRIGSHECSRD